MALPFHAVCLPQKEAAYLVPLALPGLEASDLFAAVEEELRRRFRGEADAVRTICKRDIRHGENRNEAFLYQTRAFYPARDRDFIDGRKEDVPGLRRVRENAKTGPERLITGEYPVLFPG